MRGRREGGASLEQSHCTHETDTAMDSLHGEQQEQDGSAGAGGGGLVAVAVVVAVVELVGYVGPRMSHKSPGKSGRPGGVKEK